MLERASEDQLQDNLMELLERTGWNMLHVPAVTRENGRTSTVTSGTPGWPDLSAMHRDGRFLGIELKTATGRYTPNQKIFWTRLWGYLPQKDEIRIRGNTMIGVATYKSYESILKFVS